MLFFVKKMLDSLMPLGVYIMCIMQMRTLTISLMYFKNKKIKYINALTHKSRYAFKIVIKMHKNIFNT